GGGAKFSRWLSQISDPRTRRNSDNNNGEEEDDDDPWGDRLGRLDLQGDVRMGFEDDFHLTLIPNFLHDSDAYVASLENKLERLHHISRNVSPKEMLTLMAKARAMRLKNAELNVGPNQGTEDSYEDSDYAGAFNFWTALVVPLSRRLFPRLPLSKEETQGLLKYDFLHMQCEDEARAVVIAAPNAAESSNPRPTETPQDTSREPQCRNSEERPIIVFESPEANELQIPKGWVEEEIQPKIQAETCTLPDDTVVAPANRSALSLNTNGGTVPQEASTLTSITSPSRRSEDALYHFAHFMSSATSTVESTRLEYPSESRLILLQERLSRSKLPSKERVPFMSLYGASIAHMQQSLNMVDLEIASTLAQGKSFEILQEPNNRECRVIVSRSSPSLKTVMEPQKFQAECQPGSRARQYHLVRESPGEEEGVKNENREQDYLGQRQERQDEQGQECTGQLDIEFGELEEHSPEQNSHAYEESGPGKHVGYQDAAQNIIIHESVIASSPQEDVPGVEQSTPVVEVEEEVVLLKCQEAPSQDLTLQEVTAASSSSCEGLPMEQGLWAAGLDSAAFQVPSAEDVVPHMSSLVRASEDEDEQSSVPPGSRGGYGQSSTILQTLSKASERTNDSDRESERFSHYSDPQSNLHGTESEETVTKEEGQAPMIRMFGSIPQDIHTTLKTSFCSWVQHKRLESLETARDVVSSTGSLPAVGFESTEHSRLLFKVYGEETKASSTTSKKSEPITSKASSPFSEVETIVEEQPKSVLSGMTTTSLMSLKSTDTATVVPMDENRPAVHPPGAVVATSLAFKSRKRSVHWFENCVQDADGHFVERGSDSPSPQHEDSNPGTRKKASKSFSCDLVGKAAEIHKHVEQEMVAADEPQSLKADSRKIADYEELSTEHQAPLTVLEVTMTAPAPGTYADEQRTSSTQDKSKPLADSGQEESNGKRPNTDTTVLHCSEIVYHGHFSFFAGSCKTSSTAHSSLNVVRTVQINASRQFNSSLPKRSATSLLKSDCAFNKSFLLPSALATPNKQKITQNLIIKYRADACSPSSRSAPQSKIKGRTECSALSFTPSCHPSAIIEQCVEEMPELPKVARKTDEECCSTAIEQNIPAVADMPPGPTALAQVAKSQEFVRSMAEEDAAINQVVAKRGATIEHKVDYALAEPCSKEGKLFTNTEEDLLEVKPPVEDHGSVTPVIDGCISVKVTQQDSCEFKTATQENGPARAIASKSIQCTCEGHALDKQVAEACKLSMVTQDDNRSKRAVKNDKFATYTAANSLPSPAKDAAPVTPAAESSRAMLAQDNDGYGTIAERSNSAAPMASNLTGPLTAKGYPFQSASHNPTPLISTGENYASNAPTDGACTVRMSTAGCIAQTVMVSRENMFGKPTTKSKEAKGASSEKDIAKSAPVERRTVSLGASNDAVVTSDCCCKQLLVARLHRASLVADALAKHAAGRRASTKSANADLSIAALETRERATDRLAVPKQKIPLSATEKSTQTMTEVQIGTFSSAETDLSVQQELGRSSVEESTAVVTEDSGGNAIIVGQSVLWTNGEGTAAPIENNDKQERGTLCVHLRPGPLLSTSDLREGRSGSLPRRPSNLSAYEILYNQSVSDISQ
ncbi:unnamed protein product, partial [Ixodes persulcatus]